MPYGISGPVHFHFKGCWEVLFILIDSVYKANSGDTDQMPRFEASDLGLYCLPMSHKDAGLIWVKVIRL